MMNNIYSKAQEWQDKINEYKELINQKDNEISSLNNELCAMSEDLKLGNSDYARKTILKKEAANQDLQLKLKVAYKDIEVLREAVEEKKRQDHIAVI